MRRARTDARAERPRPARGRAPITTVYLIRHGQTLWNKEQRFQGQRDVPLSAIGKRQAAALASWLRDHTPFNAIYTSDLARAAETAAMIGREIGLTSVPDAALREIDCGDWSGLRVSDIEHRYPGQLQVWRASAHQFILPGGEGVLDVQRRIVSFYSETVYRHRGETIILVGHGVALAALLIALQQRDVREAWQEGHGRMSNAGVTIVRGDHDAWDWSIPLFDGVAHLEGVPT